MSLSQLTEALKNATRIVAFTGAGVSTASGIPDFRGPSGIWKKRRPVYFQDFLTSEEARKEHWEYKLEGWIAFRDARPNPTHNALFTLEEMGKLQLLVTQNIDGLHQLAGHAPGRVIELHGTNRLIECVSCRKTFDPDPVFDQFRATRKPPLCRSCGGFLKPATISFGQQMPVDRVERALMEARQADLMLCLGSSLEVEPAASIPRAAHSAGAVYVIINQGPTAQDHLADLRMEADVSEILPRAVAALNS